MSVEYYPRFNEAFTRELEHVAIRWKAKAARRGPDPDPFDQDDLRGLALSGGGIRSASFCMGVVQKLQHAGIVDRLHYMSTVSGGGYTGSSLTWFMTQSPDSNSGCFGTAPGNFPFMGGEAAGVRNAVTAGSEADPAAAPIGGRPVLDYIRQRSSYLNPGAGFTLVSAIAIVLRSVLTSVFAFVLILAAALILPLKFDLFGRNVNEFVDLPWLAPLGGFHWPSFIALLLLALLGLSIAAYSLLTGLPWLAQGAYKLRRGYQRLAGNALALAIALLLLELLIAVIHYVEARGLPLVGKDLLALGGTSAGLGVLGGFATRAAKVVPSGLTARLVMTLVPPVALLLLLAGLGILAFELVALVPWPWLVGAALAFGLYTNINLTGLHRFYRDRLMEAFMPDPDTIRSDGQATGSTADDCDLADCCRPEHDGPFHLINAHVVLLGAGKARQRSRGGDSFVLSPLFSGSESTGFINTRDWMPGPAYIPLARRHGPLALPTAMAISGAALNPRTGADGKGPTKGGTVSALLNLLNLRLGYWVPSPCKATGTVVGAAYRGPPNFVVPGLVQGLFGFRHNENAEWLELSDGGHFENTGIYELVRRGVRTVIFADGSTDPDIALSSFANALEKIYIDFNVRVTFDGDGDVDFKKLLKGLGSSQSDLAKRLNFSEAGFAIGTIHYPDGPPGRLFYVKSTMVEKLPVALYSYKAANPLFPAESLADQFFSEQQFEAYRALGFALTAAMMDHVDGAKAKSGRSLKEWLGLRPAPTPSPPGSPRKKRTAA